MKQRIVIKYREDPAYKPSLIERNCQKRLNLTLLKHNIDFVIELFQEEVKHGPEHVCCVCHRLLFRKQVRLWKKSESRLFWSILKSRLFKRLFLSLKT